MQANATTPAYGGNQNDIPHADTGPNGARLEELTAMYGDPSKVIAHRALELAVQASFDDFMADRTGKEIIRLTDKRLVIDYRNGFRLIQQLVVDTMSLTNFRIPRSRAGGFIHPFLRGRPGRYAGKLADLAVEMFVNGMGTRKMRRAFEQTGMRVAGVSKSTMSRLTEDLRKEALAWNNRPITEKFQYLQADAIYVKARKNSLHSISTLVVIGITEHGKKQPLYFTTGTESTRNYSEIFQMLIHRGLDTKRINLLTIDGSAALIAAGRQCFGERRIQRCTVHKTWNVLKKTPQVLREELKAKLGRLWNMPSSHEAQQFMIIIAAEYENSAPNAIECLTQDQEDLLRFYECPPEHRKTVRSTNLIERVNREIRRRTKVMDTFESEGTAWKVVMGVIREIEHRWDKKSHWRKVA